MYIVQCVMQAQMKNIVNAEAECAIFSPQVQTLRPEKKKKEKREKGEDERKRKRQAKAKVNSELSQFSILKFKH